MKKEFLIFSCVISCLIGTSCKKDKLQHTTAQGLVVDATNEQPIPNALVQLVAQQQGLFSFGFMLVDSVRADANGKYFFNFQAEDDYSYFLQAYAKRHLDIIVPTRINSSEKNKTDLPLQPEAFLRINFVNIPPLDKVDELSVDAFEGYPPPLPLVNSSANYSVKGRVWGNKEKRIITRTTKNGITNQLNYFVYCQAHDTTTYSIEY